MSQGDKPDSSPRLPEAESRRVSTGASRFRSQSESRLIPAANTPRPSIDLRIDELLLDGFSPADRYAIGEAVERELTRLITDQGVPNAITYPSETAEVDGGALEPDTTSNADAIGARVARAVYGGLNT